MATVHLLIFGSVQGVGYRQFVKSNALRLGLTGWVRNLPAGRYGLPNGSVEALLQGKKEILEEMVMLSKKGPWLAEVEKVQVTWEEEKEKFEDFNIIHEL